MGRQNLTKAAMILFTLLTTGCSASAAFGETLTERLGRQQDFRPQPRSPVEQLVEVAQKFKIPMAIEWLERPEQDVEGAPAFRKGTVLDLLEAIVRRSPGHHVVLTDRVVYVHPPAVVGRRNNFLNLRIPHYRVVNESLLGAEYMLRHGINALLYPNLYKHGFGGGYGSAPDDPFWEENVTVSGDNLTIREILTRIAVANGNALWVAVLRPNEFEGGKPQWEGVSIDEYGHSPLNTRWRFIPLDEKRANARHPPDRPQLGFH